METVIQTEQLSKRFGATQAVDRLDLAVPLGAIFALLGDNGAGKTTTIRMLTGLLPPDAGRAVVLGQDCWSAAIALRSKVGYVPEKPRYYDWMTVSEIGWFTAGFHADGYGPRFRDWTQKFQLDPKARLGRLSKGEYAKVGLALALAVDPQVLILDEPTSGLDVLVRHEFLGSMVCMAAEGRTILISSHQIAEVERVASHVAFMSRGRLLLTASMDELRQRIVRLKLRSDAEPPDPGRFGSVLQRNGAGKQVHAVLQDPRREDLEALRHVEGIHDVEVTAMPLEEIYCALLRRKEGKP
jgi:ABC-2 type transport system ATP-binding protein